MKQYKGKVKQQGHIKLLAKRILNKRATLEEVNTLTCCFLSFSVFSSILSTVPLYIEFLLPICFLYGSSINNFETNFMVPGLTRVISCKVQENK